MAASVAIESNSSSMEVEVIQENFSTIVEGLEPEPVLQSIAASLCDSGLISQSEHDKVICLLSQEAAEEVLKVLLKKVETNADSFSEFVSILKDVKPDLAGVLESALDKKRQQKKPLTELVAGSLVTTERSTTASSLSSYDAHSDWFKPKSVTNLKTSSEETSVSDHKEDKVA